ncbi:MAG: hypothetical protein EOO38_29800, partial [Cytophagaceae bacterium]
VLDRKAIQEYRLWDITNLTAIAPNLFNVEHGNSTSSNSFNIRGVMGFSNEQAVATYVDGVYQSDYFSAPPLFNDVESIEILRGPQGTLYGRNAFGGVVNITTRQPGNTLAGFAEMTFGNYGQQRYTAGLSGPIVKDKLFASGSFSYSHRGSIYQNAFTNSGFDRREDYSGKEWKDGGGVDPTPGKQQRPAIDRISWLEDTNGDGAMDKKHVFYEGLELVTGLVFHKDGVIVTQAPDILWIRDTDRDGKGDKVEKLYTGLGTGDTHAIINNPRWGMDGWIYATHGYSGSQHVYNGDKSKDFGSIGSGVVRFKPDGSAIEQFSSKGGNTWGLTVTWDNEIVWTQPTSGDLVMHTVMS